MHLLFANTGIQIVCIPLPAGRRFTTGQIGYGWQHTRCQSSGTDDEDFDPDDLQAKNFPYIQWQIVQSNVSKLFLAVDTTLGDPEVGHFCDPSSLAGDFKVTLDGLLDLSGSPLQGAPKIDLVFRAATATAGEPKPVHLVVDFGNSRTGALLLELSGEVSQAAEMMPFELTNRYLLDHFNEAGEQITRSDDRWFSSRTKWCNSPLREPAEMVKKEFFREQVKGLFGSKQVKREREITVVPKLFEDLSMARMGREVDDISQMMHSKGDYRTGVSSPKRYLWAFDDSWLEGAFWYMADPHDRCNTDTFGAKVQGKLLEFMHEDDRDFLLELDPEKPIKENMLASGSPNRPRHAPRCMMTLAIYEMLCQAFSYTNSLGYRSRTSEEARSRELRSLTMTYPSGMYQEERERFKKQAQKAIEIFSRTVGRFQAQAPSLTFSIDEASAVHLTYIWSELRMLGQDPRLWFQALSRVHSPTGLGSDPPSETEGEDASGMVAAGRRRSRNKPGRPGAATLSSGDPGEADSGPQQEIRMACIDIGGGTTDLMIARYRFQEGIDDSIEGKVLHQDGISVAGDQLVKRMLEKIIVPHLADVLGLEEEDIQLLFGPEVPKNRGFGSTRIDWVNRLFVPLAQRYLQYAVEDVTDEEISHTDPELVDPVVAESLQQVCNRLRGSGYYNVQQDLGLMYEKEKFEDVVHEVFDDLLFDFCGRIVDYECDVVLLAGQPSKVGYLQDLVRTYVPLPASRIIPMYNHYAGNWYPYQDVKGHAPGIIVDPKSAVVVGAAIEFLARNGMLPQFKFTMHGKHSENTYFWGVMTESNSAIREGRILFGLVGEETKDEWTEFTTIAQRVMLGRKMVADEDAQASPIYVIKMDAGNRIGATEVNIRIRRNRANEKQEEHLEIESVTGVVAGEPAVLGQNVQFNWRTLADERYFLDTGGLDNIEMR
ncbi:virulence factor SrfB [Lignipirellula cremea]|uniref:Virulence factor SrfB n=1 Tax=Lignipirellula cremea TaxID=2528010 RepID=A0A518DTF7_9BACT|nr:virulence factor SrfB [Lignipirellula cremea]QDU95125.1 Virulence factor SrfB [Lignipirellula cremea]